MNKIAAVEKAISQKYGPEAVQNPKANWDEEREKLLNRESLRSCSVCGAFPVKSMDDICLTKFDCCNLCYVKYVEDREERWLKGWRPNI